MNKIYLIFITMQLAYSLGCGWADMVTKKTVVTQAGVNITAFTREFHLSSSTPTLTAKLPKGWYEEKSCQFADAALVPENIALGKTVFGVDGSSTGTFSSVMNSMAHRNPGVSPLTVFGDTHQTSRPLSLKAETSIYNNGEKWPDTSDIIYRDIPKIALDTDGATGQSCKFAVRPLVNCGATQSSIEAKISDCMNLNGSCTDGAYPTKSTCELSSKIWTSTAIWDGETQCNGGEGKWRLVTRLGEKKEVWQDQRSGLLWSSRVSLSTNWCQASGNTQGAPVTYLRSYSGSLGTPIHGDGTISLIQGGAASVTETITIQFTGATSFTVSSTNASGCNDTQSPSQTGVLSSSAGSNVFYSVANRCQFKITQGNVSFVSGDTFLISSRLASTSSCRPGEASHLQPASPLSLCAEGPGLNPSGEVWNAGGYKDAKGGLGLHSTPSLYWRLPTKYDYILAELNGIRFVLPDMGSSAEWTGTVSSQYRDMSHVYDAKYGYMGWFSRNGSNSVRCVGR